MQKNLLLIYSLLLCICASAQTWTQVRDIPSPRHHPVSWSIDGVGYMLTGTNASDRPTNDMYRFVPELQTWSRMSSFPGPARSFSIGVTLDSLGYIGFGADNRGYLNDLWSYNPRSRTWKQLADCQCSGRRHPAMLALNNKIYVGLGDDGSGDLNDWWAYDIATDIWSQIAALPGPRRHHPFQFVAGGNLYAGMGHGGPVIYKDWYRLDTVNNQWETLRDFPGEARVAGTQFSHNGYGYVLSGDGDNHSFMDEGEFWQYDHDTDMWNQLPPHPGVSRWAPGSLVINDDVYFFGGIDRQALEYPRDSWTYSFSPPLANEPEIAPTIKVFPNPARGYFNWQSDTRITGISISNTLGQQIRFINNPTHAVDVKDIESGLYIIQFYNGNTIQHTSRIMLRP